MSKFLDWNDTIVALATPPGIGAIGVIRVSGQQAFEIIDVIFPSKKISQQPTHTLHFGVIKNGNEILDEVVVSIFKGPKSYTGEDTVEISAHGSPFIIEQIIQLVCKHGARIAKPGEFTQRAFINGKLDLTQAEAVADLIASNSVASKNAAIKHMRGGFSHILKDLREQLIKFAALIELELDFAQEDVEFADRSALESLITEIKTTVQGLVQSFQLGNVIKNGVSVAIIGKPNAGKSTLLNSLLRENRAIVSDIAGTTRDTIEETLNINGILFRLIDTAGIRNHTTDEIEKIGIAKSWETIQKADVILYLVDVNELNESELDQTTTKIGNKPFIIVGNKVDIARNQEFEKTLAKRGKYVIISAQQVKDVEKVKSALLDSLQVGVIQTEATIITNARHYHALLQLQTTIQQVQDGLQQSLSGDLLSLEIKECLHHLGIITGEVSNEDLLDYVFSKFCIGK